MCGLIRQSRQLVQLRSRIYENHFTESYEKRSRRVGPVASAV